MDNVIASVLGRIASQVGDPKLKGVGDNIDRGLILRQLLEDNGFLIHMKRTKKRWHNAINQTYFDPV